MKRGSAAGREAAAVEAGAAVAVVETMVVVAVVAAAVAAAANVGADADAVAGVDVGAEGEADAGAVDAVAGGMIAWDLVAVVVPAEPASWPPVEASHGEALTLAETRLHRGD